jgi:hypothetical protein
MLPNFQISSKYMLKGTEFMGLRRLGGWPPLQTLNPGNLRLPFQRYANCLENTFNVRLPKPNTAPLPFIESNLKKGIYLHPPIFGASTGLLAGPSPKINSQTNGCYTTHGVVSGIWRRTSLPVLKRDRKELLELRRSFHEWCENETTPYV